jgi:GT2 family glycosyltransferase
VVVPTYQGRSSVLRLLNALNTQTIPPEDYEVIVVVDGSDDGTADAVSALRPTYVLQCEWQPNGGRASACNRGINLARGDVVVILDDDMEPTARLLEAHLDEHPADSTRCVMGAAPVQIRVGDPPVARFVARRFSEHLERLAQPDREFVLRDFYSGNASIRRDVLLAAGGYDESFRQYGNEDLELAFRLMRRGVTFGFSAEAEARQHYEKDFRRLARDTIDKGQTAVLLATMHPEARAGLRLGAYGAGPLAWRAVRRMLLLLSRAHAHTPEGLIALTAWMERIGVRRLDLQYQLVLDYLYWVGADRTIRETSSTGAP